MGARRATLLGARERATLARRRPRVDARGALLRRRRPARGRQGRAVPGAVAAVGGARLSRDAAGARRLGAGARIAPRSLRCRRRRRWRCSSAGAPATIARRTMVRMLTAPLKIAHYNDPQMYRDVGCRYGSLPVRAERPRWMERVVRGRRARRRRHHRVRRRGHRHRRRRRGRRPGARRAGPRRRAPRRGRLLHARRLHRPARRDAAQALPRHGRDVRRRQRGHPDSRSAAPSAARPPSTPAPAIARPIACCDDWGTSSGSTSSSPDRWRRYFDARRGDARRRAGASRSISAAWRA